MPFLSSFSKIYNIFSYVNCCLPKLIVLNWNIFSVPWSKKWNPEFIFSVLACELLKPYIFSVLGLQINIPDAWISRILVWCKIRVAYRFTCVVSKIMHGETWRQVINYFAITVWQELSHNLAYSTKRTIWWKSAICNCAIILGTALIFKLKTCFANFLFVLSSAAISVLSRTLALLERGALVPVGNPI